MLTERNVQSIEVIGLLRNVIYMASKRTSHLPQAAPASAKKRASKSNTQIAEYLGVDVRQFPATTRVARTTKPKVNCPFRNHQCDKLVRGQHPTCSVRTDSGNLWVTCSHRLCSTQPKAAALSAYQRSFLLEAGRRIFQAPALAEADLEIRREAKIEVTATSNYAADYVMRLTPGSVHASPSKAFPVVIEIQGGGETSNTGVLTKALDRWLQTSPPLAGAARNLLPVPPLVTNAWRRQQEQFIVKGNIASMSGARIVLIVGELLYDYLIPRVTKNLTLAPLSHANWSLAILPIAEMPAGTPGAFGIPNSATLGFVSGKSLFTSYQSFVHGLINQGEAQVEVFSDGFEPLQ